MNDGGAPHVFAPWLQGRFSAIRFLGEGARAQVWLVRPGTRSTEVALKVLGPSLARSRRERTRFRREAEGLAQVTHPHVVERFDFLEEPEGILYTMEYLAGGTLRQAVEEGPLELGLAVDYTRQVARAVAALHAFGLLHRDLKASNVMLTETGVAKLIDLGSTKQDLRRALTALTRSDQIVGTVLYQPPEVFSTRQYDERSDVYQLGLLLYELVTGRHPLHGCTARDLLMGRCVDTMQPPSTVCPTVDPLLDAVVMKALSPDPRQRPSGPAGLDEELVAWCNRL